MQKIRRYILYLMTNWHDRICIFLAYAVEYVYFINLFIEKSDIFEYYIQWNILYNLENKSYFNISYLYKIKIILYSNIFY